MAAPPCNVALVRKQRVLARCERCKFHGDSIYFNHPSQICVFCELPPTQRVIGASTITMFLNIEHTGSARVILPIDKMRECRLKTVLMNTSATCTLRTTAEGIVELAIYRLKFIDDP